MLSGRDCAPVKPGTRRPVPVGLVRACNGASRPRGKSNEISSPSLEARFALRQRSVGNYGAGPAVEEHRRRRAEVLLVRLLRRVVHGVAGLGDAAHTLATERRVARQHVVQLFGLVMMTGVVQIRPPHRNADSHRLMLDD